MKVGAVGIAALAAVAVTTAACSQFGGANGSSGDGADSSSGGGGSQASLESRRGQMDSARWNTGAALPQLSAHIVKTARLELEVGRSDLQRSVQRATAAAAQHGGFVLSTDIDSGARGAATLVLRVPADRFETALRDIEDLGEVESHSVSGEDVSAEVVDLEARLRNWRTQETVLLRLMDRAETVAATIRVQSELHRVQLEIERLRGRLRYLEDQTSLSTITATFLPDAAPVRPDTPKVLVAWRQAVDLSLEFVSAMIVSLGVIVPIAMLALVGFLAFRQFRPRAG